MRLSTSQEWLHLRELFEARFADALERLEKADEKNFKFEQGRLSELRFLLELETSAKAHLDNSRNLKRTTAID
jgi:hypothetical protein